MLTTSSIKLSSVFFFLIFVIAFSLQALSSKAQAGLTASPSRLYFQPGGKQEQQLILTNPNSERPLEIGISLNDWAYDSLGNNVTYDAGTLSTSCAKNVQVLPGSYFTIPAGESKAVTVVVTPTSAANTNAPIQTAMLYVTQLNPGDSRAENGAAIKVTVRMGIKIYHTTNTSFNKDMEITDFVPVQQDGKTSSLKLYVSNTGNIWLDGKITYEIFNKKTGKKTKLDAEDFYSLPGDKRIFSAKLPTDVVKGAYTATAIVNYGKDEGLKLAELELDL